MHWRIYVALGGDALKRLGGYYLFLTPVGGSYDCKLDLLISKDGSAWLV